MSPYEIWSLICQGMILFAGVATVIVYYRQLRAMQNQLGATEKQLVLGSQQLQAMQNQLGATEKQLAHSVQTQQTSQYQAALQLMFNWRSEAIANPKLVEHLKEETYFREVFEILPEPQYFHTLKLFHIFELYWLLKQRGVIDDHMWEGWAKNVQILMRPPKNQKIWSKLKSGGIFNPDFVEFVDDLIRRNETLSTTRGLA